MKDKKRITTIIAIVLVSFGCIYRIIPHLPNFAPITGIALLSGAVIYRRKVAFLIPILALFLGDFVINNTIARVFFTDHSGLVIFSSYMIYSYISFILITMIGMRFLKKVSMRRLTSCALTSAVVFFLITNFGTWLGSPVYPASFTGLMQSYIAALPFFRTSILADLVFTGVMFGSFYYIRQFAFHRLKIVNAQF